MLQKDMHAKWGRTTDFEAAYVVLDEVVSRCSLLDDKLLVCCAVPDLLLAAMYVRGWLQTISDFSGRVLGALNTTTTHVHDYST